MTGGVYAATALASAKDEERQWPKLPSPLRSRGANLPSTAACEDMSSRGDAGNLCATLRPTTDNVRWLARLALEGREVRLDEIPLAAAALGCLRGRRHERAVKTLLRLL